MKKCDHYKDLILTDYMDGQLDKTAAQTLEGHLLDCSDCRAFFKEVKNNTTLPFQQMVRQPAPDVLWDMIKQGIEQKDQARHPFGDVMGQLKGLLVFPRLVPVFASFMLMFLAGSATLDTIQVQPAKAQEQGEYLVSLLSPGSSSSSSESNDLGTPIENYFL